MEQNEIIKIVLPLGSSRMSYSHEFLVNYKYICGILI